MGPLLVKLCEKRRHWVSTFRWCSILDDKNRRQRRTQSINKNLRVKHSNYKHLNFTRLNDNSKHEHINFINRCSNQTQQSINWIFNNRSDMSIRKTQHSKFKNYKWNWRKWKLQALNMVWFIDLDSKIKLFWKHNHKHIIWKNNILRRPRKSKYYIHRF